jgi:hypothetical protein
MDSLNIQSLVDFTLQFILFLGNLLIDCIYKIWTSLPGMPIEIKSILISFAFIGVTIRIIKSPTASWHLREFLEKVTDIIGM